MTKEEQIMAIAEEEFIQNGYLSTSMVTVAKRAGLTHAMVNYYFRSKEQLFMKILDSHVMTFISSLKTVMKGDNDFVQTVVNASGALFSALDNDRDFPFLLQDVIRTCPELLDKYREVLTVSVKDSLSHHTAILERQIAAGNVQPTSMPEIVETVFSLTISPFMMIPALENLCGHNEEKIEDYLARRRQETENIIRARYSTSGAANK